MNSSNLNQSNLYTKSTSLNKKCYKKPILQRYGSIKEVTQKSGASTDGGSVNKKN